VRVGYHTDYWIPLPKRHPFPMGKYPALHAILLAERLIVPSDVVAPDEVRREDLLLVHTAEYVEQVFTGALTADTAKRLGFPWSPTLLRRARLAVQGTIDASRRALEDWISANLAGGTHHAFAERGEGYCTFHDVAVAIRVLQREGRIQRALVVDLDVHQGNGTASIFQHDASVFTFSMHGERNFPLRKERSSLDVALVDGLDDAGYLAQLEQHLPGCFDAARANIVFYLAGVDIAAGDRFGRLALTKAGIGARDRYVLETCRAQGVPVCIVLAGGYAKTAEITADLHAEVHRAARALGPGRLNSG